MEQKKTKKTNSTPHGMTMHSKPEPCGWSQAGPSAGGSGQRAGDLHRHAAQLAESLRYPDGPGQQTEPGAKAHPGAGSGEPQPAQAAGRERRGHRRLKKIRRHPVETVEERYRCVPDAQASGSLCGTGMPGSGSIPQRVLRLKAEKICRRRLQNQALRRRLIELHEKYPAMGLDSLYRLLKPEFGCSRKRVHRQMSLAGISSVRRRAYKKTTHSNHSHPIAPNLLQRNFSFDRPDQAWVGDITYIPTGEGWLYLAIVKDLCTRKIVGYAFSDRIDTG